MSERFKLYNVNMKYIRNLHSIDDNVPSVSPQISKQRRPFLGILVLVNGSKYCIPLTSNTGGKNGRALAGLNLNNMIPVREEYVSVINLKLLPADSEQDKQWKILCRKELNWCQEHQNEIEKLANELYRMYVSQTPFGKRKICLNFPALERECNKAKEL